MPYFKCPKCCGKSVPAGRIGCSYCNIHSNTGAGMYGNSLPEQPEVAVPREIDATSVSRYYLLPNSMPLDLTVKKQTRDGVKANNRTMQKVVQEFRANKQSMQEISKETDRNRDSLQETSAATNRMPSCNSHLVDIRKALLNNESPESICQFQGPQKDNTPVKKPFWNNEPLWNINKFQGSQNYNVPINEYFVKIEPQWNINKFQGSQKDNAPVNEDIRNSEFQRNINKFQGSQKDSAPVNEDFPKNEIQWNINKFQAFQKDNAPVNEDVRNNESQWYINKFRGSQKDNAPVNEDFRNNEFQWNINKFQGFQKYDAPVESADSSKSVREGKHSTYEFLAVAGLSRFFGSQKEPSVLDAKLKSSNAPKIQSVVPRRIITCLYCGEGFDKHTKIHQKETIYACCACKYTTNKALNILQNHICIHCSKNECNVCSKEYTEGTLHVSQQKCQLCSVTFDCRTQLDEHLLKHHEEHFRTNCWECCEPISAHYTIKEGEILFFCCMCGFETYNIKLIDFHTEAHRPKHFCKICKEEYSEAQLFHNRKYSCIVCNKEFKCRKPLEDHYDLSCSEYFVENCCLCKGIINKHTIDRQRKQYYKCCVCDYQNKSKLKLQIHIHIHTGLRLFKCFKCGKRYLEQGGRNDHSKTCMPSKFLCGICCARFPSDDSLNEHYLEKHRPTTC